jgi:hypothetical protein
MDSRLVQELELLNEVYCEELEIKPSQNFVKLRVRCVPLLEDSNIEHHYEYDHPYLYAIFDLANEYPAESPKFHLESTHSKVGIGSFLSELSEKMMLIIKGMQGDTCVLDLIEFIRVDSF